MGLVRFGVELFVGVGSCQNNGCMGVRDGTRFRCIVIEVELFFFGICVNKCIFF